MKTITAVGDPDINKRIREIKGYEVIGMDIPYEEGILEILETINGIELLILSNNLPKEYDFNILINKIKNINEKLNIIVLLKEKNQNIENFLNSKEIYRIYYVNKLKEFYESLEMGENSVEQEFEDFKNTINNDLKKERNQIITVSGTYGSGKSIISTILSKYIKQREKRVLLIDFDLFNNSINTILGINRDLKTNKRNEYCVVKVSKNLDFLNAGYLFNYNLKGNINTGNYIYEISKIIDNLRENYDFIIIDISSNLEFKYLKTTLTKANKIIFLIEPNILEIMKANYILEVYINDLKIDQEKIKIVFNKTNKYKIARSVLEELFSEYQIIGEIEYDEKYNLLINKNMNNLLPKKEYEKIYENIK